MTLPEQNYQVTKRLKGGESNWCFGCSLSLLGRRSRLPSFLPSYILTLYNEGSEHVGGTSALLSISLRSQRARAEICQRLCGIRSVNFLDGSTDEFDAPKHSHKLRRRQLCVQFKPLILYNEGSLRICGNNVYLAACSLFWREAMAKICQRLCGMGSINFFD